MKLHNAHVIKYWSWKVWVAKQLCRPLAQTFYVQWHNDELAKAGVTA